MTFAHAMQAKKAYKSATKSLKAIMQKDSPPFTISNRMLWLVASISERIGRIDVDGEARRRPHLRRNSSIASIHAYLRIEANSLSLSEVRDVIDGHAVIGDAREIREVRNAYAAYQRMDTVDPYGIDDLGRFTAS